MCASSHSLPSHTSPFGSQKHGPQRFQGPFPSSQTFDMKGTAWLHSLWHPRSSSGLDGKGDSG